jgi:hypothetical protein
MSKKHMGSSVDDFLKEEGIFEEAQAQAVVGVARSLHSFERSGARFLPPRDVEPAKRVRAETRMGSCQRAQLPVGRT